MDAEVRCAKLAMLIRIWSKVRSILLTKLIMKDVFTHKNKKVNLFVYFSLYH